MGIVGQLFFQIFIICNSSFKNEVWCRQRAILLPRLFLNSFLYKISYIFLIFFESNMFSDDKTNMCVNLIRKHLFVCFFRNENLTPLTNMKSKTFIFCSKREISREYRQNMRSYNNILYSACKYTFLHILNAHIM